MELDNGRFETRLAATQAEIEAAQRLRYDVFVRELGARADLTETQGGLERDRFDTYADHLLLIDNALKMRSPKDRIVGVYRLIRSDVALRHGGFYGASEYNLAPLINTGRPLVELGRSCMAKSHRGGMATHILWNGLAGYVLEHQIEVLFGVASFHGTDPAPLADALSLLHHEYLAPTDLRVRAQEDAYLNMNMMPRDQIDRRAAMQQIPALIKAYLRLGGCIGDGAFVDHVFNTVDVCLIMDTARMADRYRGQYTAQHAAMVS